MEDKNIVVEENALLGDNLDEDDSFAIAADSAGMGQSSDVTTDGEIGKVIRYNDPEVLKKHITEVMKIGREKTTFKGVEELKNAADEGHQFPPRLRQGQLIFGTVSFAEHMGMADTWSGVFCDYLIGPIRMVFETGEPRKYLYLHVAVYAGFHKPLHCDHCEGTENQCAGHHYVIENGGHLGRGIGMIVATPMEKARRRYRIKLWVLW